jgi:hypothetical protein
VNFRSCRSRTVVEAKPPSTDALVTYHDAARRLDGLDLVQAQAEAVLRPCDVLDRVTAGKRKLRYGSDAFVMPNTLPWVGQVWQSDMARPNTPSGGYVVRD